eukprot:426721_1
MSSETRIKVGFPIALITCIFITGQLVIFMCICYQLCCNGFIGWSTKQKITKNEKDEDSKTTNTVVTSTNKVTAIETVKIKPNLQRIPSKSITSISKSRSNSNINSKKQNKKTKKMHPFFRLTTVLSISCFTLTALAGITYNIFFSKFPELFHLCDWILAPFVTLFWFFGRLSMTAIFIGRLQHTFTNTGDEISL